MRIEKITVKNFRSLKDITTNFYNLIAFVGRNNSGKSSMLHAIDIFFTPRAKIDSEDFYDRHVETPIEITLNFSHFTPKEKDEFSTYINNDELIVTKIIYWDEAASDSVEEYYSFSKQIPEFVEIRNISGALDSRKAFNELVEKGTLPDLKGKPRSVAELEKIMKTYEDEHPERLVLVKTKGTFFGARNVGGGILDKYTKFIFLQAVKEASEEVVGKNSAVNRLIDMIVMENIQNREDLISFREEINQRISEKYSPENLGQLDELSSLITTTLTRYSPGSEMLLEWDEVVPPNIPFPSVSCSIFEEGFEGDVSRQGHGLQRAVILTLLEHLTYAIAARIGGSDKGSQPSPLRIDSILAIEEPELYLHPSRCRYFSNILLQLAERDIRGAGSSTQILYSTHSPYFVGLERFDNIRLFKKRQLKNQVPFTEINYYSIAHAAARFEEVCGSRTYRNPVENFRLRSLPVMNTIMNEGFFADLVVIIEGQSDLGVLWKLQEILGKNWDQSSISMLPARGKGNIIKSKIIFDGLKIPNYVVFDKDISIDRNNQRLLRLVNFGGIELPTIKIHNKWAYNDHNLESELIRMLTEETYEEIWGKINAELDCDDERIRKNPEATARFTEIVYERDLNLPHYENIIKKIDELHKNR